MSETPTMTFWDHLDELRSVIIRTVVVTMRPFGVGVSSTTVMVLSSSVRVTLVSWAKAGAIRATEANRTNNFFISIEL